MSSISSLRGSILVVGREENVREPLIEMLRLNCYRVIAVENGEQAFEQACSQPVDLALFDVMMPGPTGFSVCRAIKDRPETRFLPIVLITGLACGEDPYTEGPCDRLSRSAVSLAERVWIVARGM